VNPAQKNRIILALKARGRVVGYLGDGINDAPALHSADVSLSVDTAVDVAKEAADLILLKRDLQVLHDGVLEGRRTFANIRKYIMMGTSSSFGNMFSMAAASVFLPFLPMLPAQILLNNVLYDLSEVAIPLDHVDAEEIRRPQAWDMTFIRNFMWVIGPVSSLFDFLTFYVLLAVLNANEGCSRPAGSSSRWRRRCGDFRHSHAPKPAFEPTSPALAATSLAVVLAALILRSRRWDATSASSRRRAEFWGILVGLVVAYLGIVETAKRLFYRYLTSKPK
jgi:Mg2+-importing ATPase